MKQIKFNNEEELFDFQKFFLGVSSSFKEVKQIMKLSHNLTKSLKFLIQNFKMINKILQNDRNYKIGSDNFLDFSDLNKDDKIEDIYQLIRELKRINNINEFKQIIIILKNYAIF